MNQSVKHHYQLLSVTTDERRKQNHNYAEL